MISQNSTIGFIGLGAMGQRMARRLLDNGFKLMAYDHTIRKTAELASNGAMIAPNLRQLARKSEVVILVPAQRRGGSERLSGSGRNPGLREPRNRRYRDEHRLAGYVARAASEGDRAQGRSPGCTHLRQYACR